MKQWLREQRKRLDQDKGPTVLVNKLYISILLTALEKQDERLSSLIHHAEIASHRLVDLPEGGHLSCAVKAAQQTQAEIKELLK